MKTKIWHNTIENWRRELRASSQSVDDEVMRRPRIEPLERTIRQDDVAALAAAGFNAVELDVNDRADDLRNLTFLHGIQIWDFGCNQTFVLGALQLLSGSVPDTRLGFSA